LLTNNHSPGSNTDPEYNKCYGTSKRASRNVQGWLERQAGWEETTSKVSDLQGLAKDLVAKGVQMPADVLDDLTTTIDIRRELNDLHKSRGNCDKQHIYALAAYEKVLATFNPSHSSSRRFSSSSSSSSSTSSSSSWRSPQSSPLNSPRQAPTQPSTTAVQKEAVTPLFKCGNPAISHPYLNTKPTYTEEDPFWE